MAEYIKGHVNLFGAWIPGVTPDDVIARKAGTEVLRDLIEAVLERNVDTLEKSAIERFADLSPQELYVAVVPDETKLIDRLIRPLKSAKRLYCFGEYLATIALCGLVGETLAMLLYRLQKPDMGGHQITLDQEKQLFGSEFDRLGQERRVQVLKCLGLVTDGQEKLFSDLRLIRRRYLHLWKVDTSRISMDAKDCFISAMRLFKEISGLGIDANGGFVMNPHLLRYIKEREQAEVQARVP